MKCNEFRPGFELVSSCSFPTTITITPQAPPTLTVAYIYILDTYWRNDNRRSNKRRRKEGAGSFFTTYFTSHFICKVSKWLFKVCMWEGAETEHTLYYFDPTVMTVTLCLSCSPDVGVHSIGGFPRAPSVGCGLPYHIWSLLSGSLLATALTPRTQLS